MAKKRKNNVQRNRISVPNTCKVSNWLLHSNTPNPSIFGQAPRPRTFFTIGENSQTPPVVNQRPRTFFTIGAPMIGPHNSLRKSKPAILRKNP